MSGQSYTDAFSYDLVGNRLTKTHTSGGNSESIAYAYNNDDQLQTETGTLNGSPEYATAYGYDANGSLTSKTRTGTNAETDGYTYDLQNHLASSTVNGTTTTYATDSAGDRVSGTTGGATTSSLVNDKNLTGYSQVLEQTTGGSITTSYILGDHVLGQGSAGTPSYLVVDGQGSTRLVTDATGTVNARYSFDAFGNLLGTSTSGLVTSILYTGQQFDAGLGMYHLRARDYNPLTGTFSSFDSEINGNADPRDLHKYLYTNADPIDNWDPTGHFISINGLSAQAQITRIYKRDHTGDTIRSGIWLFGLFPDIQDWTTKEWLEVKPFTPTGVDDAVTAIFKYAPGAIFGWLPDHLWTPSTNTIVINGQPESFFNAGGIVFYGDQVQLAAETILGISLLTARAVAGYLPQIYELIGAGQRAVQLALGPGLESDLGIATLNGELGAV